MTMDLSWDDYFSARSPRVMGIINLSPDSFFPDSRRSASQPEELLRQVDAMQAAGVDILDLGAESTRPGSQPIDPAVEADRLLPALALIRAHCGIPVSVDTRHPASARQALDAGAHIINDISAGREEEGAMLDLAAARGCPLILMHMQGTPADMQAAPRYQNVVAEVEAFLIERVAAAQARGVRRVWIDPGIGFGKTLDHNLALLASLDRLVALGHPVLVGHSRKSFIGQILAGTDEGGSSRPRPSEGRLAGGLAVAAWSAFQGAALIRTHDVAETVDALRVCAALAGKRRELQDV